MIHWMTSGNVRPQTVATIAATAEAASDGSAGRAKGSRRFSDATVGVVGFAGVVGAGEGGFVMTGSGYVRGPTVLQPLRPEGLQP